MKSELDWHAFVEERLSDYLDGQLNSEDMARVREHLSSCQRCQASLESLRWTVNLLHQVPAPALPRQFTLPVTSRVPAAGGSSWWVWGLRGIAIGATAAFVLLLTVNLLQQSSTSGMMTAQAPAGVAPTANIAIGPTAAPAQPTAADASRKAIATIPPFPTPIQPTAAPIPITVTPEPELPPQAPLLFATDVPTLIPLPPQPTGVPPRAQQAPTPTETLESMMSMAAPSNESANAEPSPTSVARKSAADLAPKIGLVRPTALMVRAGPGTQYAEIGTLRRNEKVTITGRDRVGGWLQIEYPKNRRDARGWVATSLIQTNVSLETLPIVASPSDESLLPTAVPSPTPTLTPTPSAATTVPTEPNEQASPTPSAIAQPPNGGSVLATPTDVPTVAPTESELAVETATPAGVPQLKPTRARSKP